jgi:hypothetical protein
VHRSPGAPRAHDDASIRRGLPLNFALMRLRVSVSRRQ